MTGEINHPPNFQCGLLKSELPPESYVYSYRFMLPRPVFLGLVVFLSVIYQSAQSQAEESVKTLTAAIIARIQSPVFPDKDFPITEFGARNDGDSSAAISKAIHA